MSAASSPARQNQPEAITLVEAAKCGDVGTVEVLIAAGADVNAATQHGMTALMNAAANGHLGLVSLLIERGADINAKRCDTLDALALAVFFGHLHVVRELLGRGADPKAKSRFGTSPEMWATVRGFHNIAQILTNAETANYRETPAHRSDESNAPPGSPSPGSPAVQSGVPGRASRLGCHTRWGGSEQPAWAGGSPELTGAQEPILREAFFSAEGLSDVTLSHATEASPVPAQILSDSTHDDEWTMGSTNPSEQTLESPASVWNMTDEAHKENQVQPRNSGTEVTHNGAELFAPVITQRPRALPVEKQPSPIYSTYVAKPRYHHKRKSRLVRCLSYITSGWQRLTVVTLIVMLLCGLGTLAFLKLLGPSKPFRAAKPANVAEPSAPALPHFNATNDPDSTTREEEIPSKRTRDDVSGGQSVDSAKKSDVGSRPEVDRIEHPSYSRVAEKPLRKPAERVTGARPEQGMTPRRETQGVSRPAPSFRSASVSAKRIPSRNAADAADAADATDATDATDIALEDRRAKVPPPAPPAPLTIEVQRPRSVSARNDSPMPSPPAPSARASKTKVIQWP